MSLSCYLVQITKLYALSYVLGLRKLRATCGFMLCFLGRKLRATRGFMLCVLGRKLRATRGKWSVGFLNRASGVQIANYVPIVAQFA